jgi:hypothetical protein
VPRAILVSCFGGLTSPTFGSLPKRCECRLARKDWRHASSTVDRSSKPARRSPLYTFPNALETACVWVTVDWKLTSVITRYSEISCRFLVIFVTRRKLVEDDHLVLQKQGGCFLPPMSATGIAEPSPWNRPPTTIPVDATRVPHRFFVVTQSSQTSQSQL